MGNCPSTCYPLDLLTSTDPQTDEEDNGAESARLLFNTLSSRQNSHAYGSVSTAPSYREPHSAVSSLHSAARPSLAPQAVSSGSDPRDKGVKISASASPQKKGIHPKRSPLFQSNLSHGPSPSQAGSQDSRLSPGIQTPHARVHEVVASFRRSLTDLTLPKPPSPPPESPPGPTSDYPLSHPLGLPPHRKSASASPRRPSAQGRSSGGSTRSASAAQDRLAITDADASIASTKGDKFPKKRWYADAPLLPSLLTHERMQARHRMAKVLEQQKAAEKVAREKLEGEGGRKREKRGVAREGRREQLRRLVIEEARGEDGDQEEVGGRERARGGRREIGRRVTFGEGG